MGDIFANSLKALGEDVNRKRNRKVGQLNEAEKLKKTLKSKGCKQSLGRLP